jgi:hypothetical protein
MIEYAKTNVGDILEITGAGAPGYARNGDLVRVKQAMSNGVLVEDVNGEECKFVFNCGAARLNPTEWKNDFPVPQAAAGA